MQTSAGRDLLTRHGLDPSDPKSFLLLEGGRGYMDTNALIRVLTSFGGVWRAVALMIRLCPRFLRDALYRAIARNRYKLFGRHALCIVPDEQTAHRFLS
jgi:predicted DCC family thiol-disulfide oxidoreductase YuxK